jgi:hypothetical protein
MLLPGKYTAFQPENMSLPDFFFLTMASFAQCFLSEIRQTSLFAECHPNARSKYHVFGNMQKKRTANKTHDIKLKRHVSEVIVRYLVACVLRSMRWLRAQWTAAGVISWNTAGVDLL